MNRRMLGLLLVPLFAALMVLDPMGVAVARSYGMAPYSTGMITAHSILGSSTSPAEVATGDGWNVELIGHLDLPTPDVHEVIVVDSYAYIAAAQKGLRIIDVSDPTDPIEVASYDTPGVATSVAIVGNHAYLVDYDSTLHILDVTNPRFPERVGHYDGLTGSIKVAADNHYAYIASSLQGLRIIDVSNPFSPREVGDYSDGWTYYYSVSQQGSYAYMGGDFALTIFNVANPSAPRQVEVASGYFTVSNDLVAIDNYVYVVGGIVSNALSVFDVTDPTNAMTVGFHEIDSPLVGVDVNGNYAYIADLNYGLRVIHVADVTNPIEVGNYEITGQSSDVTANGSYAYLVGDDGLSILRFTEVTQKYAISGHIQNQSGTSLSGVSVCTQNNQCGTTGSNGNYTIPNLAAGIYTLAPTKSGYSFSPGTRMVTLPPSATAVDFMATSLTYSIAGHIQNQSGIAISGVSVCTQNNQCATTGSSGNYTITNLAAGTYILTPDMAGYAFTPSTSQPVSVPPNRTGIDFSGRQTSVIDLRFRPDPDGFQFSNSLYRKIGGQITLEDWRYIFGDSAVCWPFTYGSNCLETPISWLVRHSYNDKLGDIGGRCSSIAATSLMLFKQIGPHESRNQPFDFGGAQTTYRIKSDNVDIRSYIDMVAIRHSLDPVKSFLEDNQLKPSEVLEAIRNGISGNNPVVLFIRKRRDERDLHALVPYLIEDKGNGLYWVHVYDPNRPAPDSPEYGSYHLKIDTSQETWEWTFWYYEDGPEVWRGDENSHTLQHIPISLWTQRPPRCPWCFTGGRVEEPTTYIVIGTGPGYLRIGDGEGEIGFDDGEFVNEMPGASADFLIGGLGYDGDPIYQIPIRFNAEDNPYSISFEPNNGESAHDAPRTVTFIGSGRGFSVENIVAPRTTSASLSVLEDGSAVTITANDPQQVNIKLAVDTDADSTLYQLDGVDMTGANQTAWAAYYSDDDLLVLDGSEASGGQYNLSIDAVNAAGEHHFKHNGVPIGGQDSHLIDVSAWQRDGYVTVREFHDGVFKREYQLENTGGNEVRLPLILSR